MIRFDTATAFQIAGLLYLLMPLVVWVTLAEQRSRKVALWCAGGLLFGIGTFLIGLREHIPPWLSVTLGNILVFVSLMMRIHSLRLDLGVPWRPAWMVAAVLAYAGAHKIIQDWLGNDAWRVQFGVLLGGALILYLATLARRIAKNQDSGNANWIAGVYLLLGSTFMLRFLELITEAPATTILVSHATTDLMVVAGLLSAVVGNVAYIGIFLDRSHQRENLETLRNLSMAVEQLPASVAITDGKIRIQYVNAGFSESTGYSAAEVFGKNPRLLQSGQTPRKTYLEMWGKLSKGLAWEGELLNRRKNGELFWEEVNIAPVKNPTGVVTHYVAVKTDITGRKQAGEALRISEHRLRLLADNARDVVWNMAADGRITYVSPSVEKVRGYTPAEVMQHSIGETLTPDSLATALAFFTQVQSDMAAGLSPQNFRGELEYRCKDGSTFWGEVMAYPLVDAEGVLQILGVTRDIADLKRHSIELENESRQMTAQIAQLDRQRSLGEMSASLSHELNQPLTAILTNAQVAQRGLQAGRFEVARVGEFLDKIIFNTRRAGEIIEKIRSFIRPAEAAHIAVDLQRLTGDILNLVGPEATEHKVIIVFAPLASPMWVQGDATQLSQVLMNIYRNAIEALHESARREIHVRLMQFGDRVSLSVCDTGPGLAPGMLENAGTPFLSTKAGGLGLGLSISRSIIAQHQGTLTIGNAGNGGVCIDIDLPALPSGGRR